MSQVTICAWPMAKVSCHLLESILVPHTLKHRKEAEAWSRLQEFAVQERRPRGWADSAPGKSEALISGGSGAVAPRPPVPATVPTAVQHRPTGCPGSLQ